MKTLITVLSALAACLLAGCATQTLVPVDVDGSRADGTVIMVTSGNASLHHEVDWDAGMRTANERCAGWGYGGVETFGGFTTRCTAMHPILGGCMVVEYRRIYQCTDAGATNIDEIISEVDEVLRESGYERIPPASSD